MNDFLWGRLREALGAAIGWSATVVGTLIFAFCLGYWLGHREITSAEQTLRAFFGLFYWWLGYPPLIYAWFFTAFVWYLPIRVQSLGFQSGMLAAHFAIWSGVVYSLVVETERSKWFRF